MSKKSLFYVLILLIPLLSSLALPATIYVPKDYSTIQQAIDVSVNGDSVRVAPGTYVENLDFKGKAIHLISTQGPEKTTIDGAQKTCVIKFLSNEGQDSILEGFTISNGVGVGTVHWTHGGGVYCELESSPTLRNNIIKENSADYGGGVAFKAKQGYPSSPFMEDCIVRDNTAARDGGGLCVKTSIPTIRSCSFINNTAQTGGGLYSDFYSSPIIENNKFLNNTAAGGLGGGIANMSTMGCLIQNNYLSGNMAQSGGGLYTTEGAVNSNLISHNQALNGGGGVSLNGVNYEFNHNEICYNKAGGMGGGMTWNGGKGAICNNFIHNNSTAESSPYSWAGGLSIFSITGSNNNLKLINCIIANNKAQDQGGGVWMRHAPVDFINCTISGNYSYYGSGIYMNDTSEVKVFNSIVYDNDGGEQINYEVAPPIVTYSNIENGWTGTGNIDRLPGFVNPLENDFHLTRSSPCRNVGSNSVYTLSDFEGDPRVNQGIADMGADEYHEHLYHTGGAIPGETIKIKAIGISTASPVYVWCAPMALEPALKTPYGKWFLDLPFFLLMKLENVSPGSGFLEQSFYLKSSFPEGSYYLQALIGKELSNLHEIQVR